jgi:hypothetical protein
MDFYTIFSSPSTIDEINDTPVNRSHTGSGSGGSGPVACTIA